MRVLLAHNQYAITGGADVFYRDVGRVLESKGNDVAYFSAKQAEPGPQEWTKYFPEAPNYQTGNMLRRIASFPKMVYSREAKSMFASLLRDWRPDLVHAFAIYTKLTPSILDAAAEANVPMVMTCNDYKLICPNYSLFHHGHLCEECKGGRFYHAARNRCSHDSLLFSTAIAIESAMHRILKIYERNIDTYLFESSFIARKYEEFLNSKSFRWRLMTKPFNSRQFVYSPAYEDFLLYVGRLHETKGVDVLLHAMRDCPNARLVIIGDGPQRSALANLSKELGLRNVNFLGWKDNSEVTDYIARCRFGVVPSVWYENYPYVITQMFALGKPCIGSRIGGIPELIRHREFGLLCSHANAEELADSIRTIWDNPSWGVQMGHAAKMWADEHFNDVVVYDNLMDVYTEVLKRHHAKS